MTQMETPKCEITKKIKSGKLEELILFARLNYELDRSQLVNCIVVDQNEKSALGLRLRNIPRPVALLTNGRPDNTAIIYQDHSQEPGTFQDYTLAQYVQIDDGDFSGYQWFINKIEYYPSGK